MQWDPAAFRSALLAYSLTSWLALAAGGCGLSTDGFDRYRLDDEAGSAVRSDGGNPFDGGTIGSSDAGPGNPSDSGTEFSTDAAADGSIPSGPEPLVLTPVADAYVNASDPKKNYGAAKKILVDKAPERYEALAKFAVPALRDEVRSATLRLWVTDASDNGPKVFLTTDPWTEAGVNWDNRPQKSGAAVSDVGKVKAGWLEFDVTGAISDAGEISFLLLPDSEDGVDFESREASHKPELVVVTEARTCDGSPQPLAQLGKACCTATELACAGHAQKLVLVCDANLTWSALHACAGDTLCDSRAGTQQGTCQPPAPGCIDKQPGDVFCREQALVKCGPDLVTSEETACPEICVAGQCELACPTGEKQCKGLVPQTCMDTGLWMDGPACDYVCIGGACAGECVPSTKRCDGLVPQTCDAQGQWQNGTTCPYACTGGICTGDCSDGPEGSCGFVSEYQAEDMTDSFNCSIATSIASYTGTGYVDFADVGAWMEWNDIVIPAAGSFRLSFRYGVGMGADRRCSILVDGATVGEVLFPNTGLWTSWMTDSITVDLPAGVHTIRVHAVSSAGPNLDRLDLLPP